MKISLNYATLSFPKCVTQTGHIPEGMFASPASARLRRTSYVNNPLSATGNVHLVELPQPAYRLADNDPQTGSSE